jgi:hypothetical protein
MRTPARWRNYYSLWLGLVRTGFIHVYDRTFGDLPARNTVFTPYIYMVLANPIYNSLSHPALRCLAATCVSGWLLLRFLYSYLFQPKPCPATVLGEAITTFSPWYCRCQPLFSLATVLKLLSQCAFLNCRNVPHLNCRNVLHLNCRNVLHLNCCNVFDSKLSQCAALKLSQCAALKLSQCAAL